MTPQEILNKILADNGLPHIDIETTFGWALCKNAILAAAQYAYARPGHNWPKTKDGKYHVAFGVNGDPSGDWRLYAILVEHNIDNIYVRQGKQIAQEYVGTYTATTMEWVFASGWGVRKQYSH